MFCVVTEETDRVIGERRLALLREFGAQLAASQTTDDVWRGGRTLAWRPTRETCRSRSTYLFDDDGRRALASQHRRRRRHPIAQDIDRD